jgi:hypothetical protein
MPGPSNHHEPAGGVIAIVMSLHGGEPELARAAEGGARALVRLPRSTVRGAPTG